MNAYAKRKWTIDKKDYEDEGAVIFIEGADGTTIAKIEGWMMDTEANAKLIVTAVNACAKLNPDNPQAVAEGIPDLYEACGLALKLADAIVKQVSGDNVEVLMARATIKKALAKVNREEE